MLFKFVINDYQVHLLSEMRPKNSYNDHQEKQVEWLKSMKMKKPNQEPYMIEKVKRFYFAAEKRCVLIEKANREGFVMSYSILTASEEYLQSTFIW